MGFPGTGKSALGLKKQQNCFWRALVGNKQKDIKHYLPSPSKGKVCCYAFNSWCWLDGFFNIGEHEENKINMTGSIESPFLLLWSHLYLTISCISSLLVCIVSRLCNLSEDKHIFMYWEFDVIQLWSGFTAGYCKAFLTHVFLT